LEIELDEDDRLKSVQDEKDYYKSRATEAKEDLDRVKSELDYLRRALDQENRTLVNELAELRLKTSLNHSHHNTATTATTASDSFSTTTASSSACNNNSNTIITTTTAATTNNNNTVPSPTDIIINSIEMNMPEPVNDFWSSSRIRQRSSGSHNNKVGSGNYKKKRTVQDLHEV
jgi:activator of HSP90 ATPase